MYSYDEVIQTAKEFFHGAELPADVWVKKYCLMDNDGNYLEKSPDQTIQRIAREFHRMETKKFKNPMSYEEIYDSLKDFGYIICQGSPMYGIGNFHQYISIGNCFVLSSPKDSYGGILDTDQEIVQISKRRGGCGIDVSHIRPEHSPTSNSSRTSTGIIPFMERFSNSLREVGQFGRRAAGMMTISVHHPQVLDFIKVKNDEVKVTGANLSVKLTHEFMKAVIDDTLYEQRFPVDGDTPSISKMVSAKEIWNAIIYNAWLRAEPGILFWDTIIEESPADCYSHLGFKTVSTNPCLSGETKVYVADGRGEVTIKELAKEGKDVDVFCFDDKQKVVVRRMRHPRITGHNQEIYKVTLDDGSIIRVTKNHKFLTTDGNYKEVANLAPGDSLKIITRKMATIKDVFPNANSNSQDYFWIQGVLKTLKSEHRLIVEHHYGPIPKGYVVHHKDYDAQNNSPDNLEVMKKEDHDELHAKDMIGDRNPMRRAQTEWSEEKWADYHRKMSASVSGEKNGRYSGYTNDKIIERAVELTKSLGRRFSRNEWRIFAERNNLPVAFGNKFREDLGSVKDLSIRAAEILGLDDIHCDPRLVKTKLSMIEQGYKARIENNQVLVTKVCEYCKEDFETPHDLREVGYCSRTCSNHGTNFAGAKDKRADSINRNAKNHADEVKERQLKVFTGLKFDLGRRPMLKEWENACRGQGVPFRLKSKYAFQTYAELEEAAQSYNHRVVSVEVDGREDVYNGTVDDFHNFFVGGFEGVDENGKRKSLWLNNLQCGELPLSERDSCRLLILNLVNFVENPYTESAYFDYDKFYKYAGIAQKYMDHIVDLEIEQIDRILDKIETDPEPESIKRKEKELWEAIKWTCANGRRTGTGVTALGDTLASLGIGFGTEKAIEVTEKIYRTLKLGCYRSSVDMAKEIGPFPIWDYEKEKDHPFLNRIAEEDPEIYREMKIYGRRNIALLTSAPTGTVSLLAKLGSRFGTTSGIEPLFTDQPYRRRRKINPSDVDAKVDFVDAIGDRWQEYDVYPPSIDEWKMVSGKDDISLSPYHKHTANDLDWAIRVRIQAALTRHLDHSASSTVNLPNNVTVDKVAEIYETAYKSKCKGMTVYRDGCRTGVLIHKEEKAKASEDTVVKNHAPKRPKKLPCQIHNINVKGQKYNVVIGMMGDDPYEVYAIARENYVNIKEGFVVKKSRGAYQLTDVDGNEVIPNVVEHLDQNETAITRLTSAALRHGADLNFLVHQLEKSGGDLSTFPRSLSRALKKLIPDGTMVSGETCPGCGQDSLRRTEGCISCPCGFSKC